MVQTYQSPVRVYKYPFELVMAAYEKRFPTCPLIPIFVGSDITQELKADDGSSHYAERRCKLHVDVPYILKKIAGVEHVIFIQSNDLSWRNRTLNIIAYNHTFSSRVIVKEQCRYYVHPENEEWTCFEQTACLDVKSFFGFEATVEKIAMKQYAANISKGKEIIEHYVAEIIEEGGDARLTRWQEPSSSSSIDTGCSNDSSAVNIPILHASDDLSDSDDEYHTPPKHRSRTVTLNKNELKPQNSLTSTEDGESKLETEYIHRFLGDLSPLQESRLCELRHWITTSHKGNVPNDAHLLRFLRARDFDVLKAREMLLNSIMWRKRYQVDKILSSYKPSNVLLQFFAGAWHYHDLEGRPVFVWRMGQTDIKGILKSVGEENLVKFILSICEEGLRKTEEATIFFGKPISTWTLLLDLEGLSMRHLWRPGIRSLLKIIELVENNYPETMGLSLVVRAPRVAPVLWTLIGPLINENTRQKFMVYSGKDYTGPGGLVDYIDSKYIPEFLGSKCFCVAPEGGIVPKSLYLPDEVEGIDGVRDRSPSGGSKELFESLYHKAHIYKGLPYEALIPVSIRGCVITWDFDICKGECEFVLLRSTKIFQPELVQPATPNHTTLSPTGLVAAISHSSPVAFEKTLQLGFDLFMETKPIKCTEGDSIQGSHYCSQPGTYILQWRYNETQTIGSFDFTLPTQKAKVLYYHQLLDAVNFRGSMASLESCRSSFSSLSLTTTHSAADTPSSSHSRGLYKTTMTAISPTSSTGNARPVFN